MNEEITPDLPKKKKNTAGVVLLILSAVFTVPSVVAAVFSAILINALERPETPTSLGAAIGLAFGLIMVAALAIIICIASAVLSLTGTILSAFSTAKNKHPVLRVTSAVLLFFSAASLITTAVCFIILLVH